MNFRIKNSSSHNFAAVLVNPTACSTDAAGSFNYETVNAGDITQYHTFDYSNMQQAIKVSIGNQNFMLNHSTCDGSVKLSDGNYTLQLSTYETNGEVVSVAVSVLRD